MTPLRWPSSTCTSAHQDWVLDDTVFDVWAGTDSNAGLTASFRQRRA